jgi:hypothetical protein
MQEVEGQTTSSNREAVPMTEAGASDVRPRGGSSEMMQRRGMVLTAVCAGLAVTLTACGGTGSSAPVVKRASHPVTAGTPTPSVPSTSGTGTATTTAPPSTVTPSAVVDTQALDQIGTQLGSLDHSLGAASSDLTDPHGDS